MTLHAHFPTTAEQVKLAAEMYIYGYPLVESLDAVAGFAAGGGPLPVNAPFNQFGAARRLLGPETTFVSPNNDTLYLIAAIDVGAEPLVLHVPDTQRRYYVLQFVDAWTNNFAYIGRRATGTDAADFLLASAGYDGEVPHGMQVVEAPTTVAMIVGRIQVDGAADLPAVHALQDQFTLTPLSIHRGDAAPATAPPGVPAPAPRVEGELLWWEKLRVELAAFQPPQADAPVIALAAKLGLTAAESPFAEPDPALAAVLTDGAEAGRRKIDELAKGAAKPVNGWQSAMHLFDYNADFLGLGTIDTPEWTIADRQRAYAIRAAVARGGMYGNHGYEADYELVYVDGDGDQLNGAHAYELHLERTPPVDAFWSLTMYNMPKYLLEANPIDRYSIGDRTPGLRSGDDGSVTIYMQRENPGPGRESNWLPTPAGDFRPIMRMYQPRPEVLEGSYTLPAIKKVS